MLCIFHILLENYQHMRPFLLSTSSQQPVGSADRQSCGPHHYPGRERHRAGFYRGVETTTPFSFRISLSPCGRSDP